MALAGVMLGERITAVLVVGGALILGGVWLVDRAGTPSPALPLKGPQVAEAKRRGGGKGGG